MVLPVTVTAKGSSASKTNATTVTISSVALAAGETLLVAAYGHFTDQTSTGIAVTWGGTALTNVSYASSGGFHTEACGIWRLPPDSMTPGTQNVVVSISTGGVDFNDYAVSAIGVKGLQKAALPPYDSTNFQIASTTSPQVTLNSVDKIPTFIYMVSGINGPTGDSAGTWQSPMTGISRFGTTGQGATSNVTMNHAYSVNETSGSQSPNLNGITSRTVHSAAVAIPVALVSMDALMAPEDIGTMHFWDNFRRSPSAGLGVSESGHTWNISSSTWVACEEVGIQFSDGEAQAGFASINNAGGYGYVPTTSGLSVTNQHLTTRFGFRTGCSNDQATAEFMLRIQAGANSTNRLWYELLIKKTASTMTMRVLAGGTQIIAPVTVSGMNLATDAVYLLRYSATGTSPTTISAKIWDEGEPEPPNFQLQGTNSTSGYQAALSYPGFGSRYEGVQSSTCGDTFVDWMIGSTQFPPVDYGFTADAFIRDLTEEGSFTADSVLQSATGTREKTFPADAAIGLHREGPYERFRDTFTGTGQLINHTSDSGHAWNTSRDDAPNNFLLQSNRLWINVNAAHPVNAPIYNGEVECILNLGPDIAGGYTQCGFSLWQDYTEADFGFSPQIAIYAGDDAPNDNGILTPWHNHPLWGLPWSAGDFQFNTQYSFKLVKLGSKLSIYVNDTLEYEDDWETGLVHQHHPSFEDPHTPLNDLRFGTGPWNVAVHQVLAGNSGSRWIDTVIYRDYLCVVANAYIVPRNFKADAIFKKTTAGSFIGRAIIKATASASITANAVIVSMIDDFTADAILLKNSGTVTFTADAELAAQATYGIVAEAWIAGRIVAEAWIAGRILADAVISAGMTTEEGSFTSDAELVAAARMRHSRALHTGTDTVLDHVLAFTTHGLPQGLGLHEVLVELDRRVTALEQRTVADAREFRWFFADAVIRTTKTHTIAANALLIAA